MDPRLEFAFQLLMDATQLSRHEVMDHVFEGDMLDEINLLFQPHMRSTLVWYYQEVDEPETLRPLEIVIVHTTLSLLNMKNNILIDKYVYRHKQRAQALEEVQTY